MLKLFAVIMAVLLIPPSTLAGDKIRIGTEGAYPPFNFIADDGSVQGFDIDIAKALCEQMKADCEFVLQPWQGIIPALQKGKYDAIIASMSITEDRKRFVAFTDHYYSSKLQFIGSVSKDLDTSVAGLQGKVLGAQRATISDDWLVKNLGDKAKIKVYDIQEHAYLDLIAGRLDGVLAGMLVNWSWLRTQAGSGFELKGTPVFDNDKIAIAVRKDDETLRERFNAALKAIRADGTYERINAKYFPFSIY